MCSVTTFFYNHANSGSNSGPPKIVGIIPLSYSADVSSVLYELVRAATWSTVDLDAASAPVLTHALYSKYKSRCTYLTAEFNMESALEVASVSDIVLLVVKALPGVGPEFVVDETGSAILSAIRATGLPQSLACVQGLECALGEGAKQKRLCSDTRKMVQRTLDNLAQPGIKLVDQVGSDSPMHSREVDELVRSVSALSGREVTWRAMRTCLVADELEVGEERDAEGRGRVRLSGYLRGCPLLVHSLMHLPGVGTARIVRVAAVKGPVEQAARMLRRRADNESGAGLDDGELEVVEADPTR
jgi:pre-rRNA-processing protein TSR1